LALFVTKYDISSMFECNVKMILKNPISNEDDILYKRKL